MTNMILGNMRKGTMSTLCSAVIMFCSVSGCGISDEDNGTKIITPEGLEYTLGGHWCDCRDELYYYYSGEKRFIDDRFLNNWLRVGFYPQATENEIMNFISETGVFEPVDAKDVVPQYEDLNQETLCNYQVFINTKAPQTCSQLKEIIRRLEESPMVKTANLAFCLSEYNCSVLMAYAGVIIVRVKDKNDLSDLYDVMRETKTQLDESLYDPDPFFATSFYLTVDKHSTGNALEIANYIYETGKFLWAEPTPVVSKSISVYYIKSNENLYLNRVQVAKY